MSCSCNLRIGNGYDVHRLESGRALVLGGVLIPFEKGLLGHSDADVLTHAVTDAVLGAAALGDIGKLFPDCDDKYKGISSLILLEQAVKVCADSGFHVVNVDSVVIAQQPKMSPYIIEMRENIANALGVCASQVSVKATTEEGLGVTGEGRGIAAQAVCLLERR